MTHSEPWKMHSEPAASVLMTEIPEATWVELRRDPVTLVDGILESCAREQRQATELETAVIANAAIYATIRTVMAQGVDYETACALFFVRGSDDAVRPFTVVAKRDASGVELGVDFDDAPEGVTVLDEDDGEVEPAGAIVATLSSDGIGR